MANVFFNSYGIIDDLDIADGVLAIDGWVGSPEVAIDELHVSIDARLIYRLEGPWLTSPDVHAAWPQLRSSERCRFSFRVPLEDKLIEAARAGAIIAVTPKSDGRHGVPLERMWPLTYGAPTIDEADEVGKGDFTTTSFEFLSLFRLTGNLHQQERILDAGCGIGRMAFALAHYLKPPGTYDGFDVAPKFIDSAKRRFQATPHFQFRHVDVFNQMYNPQGQLAGDTFEFPYESGSFDFVFLTSVFTHMLPADLNNYLRQIRRVLRPTGRCLATFFILDDEARINLEQDRAALPLPDSYDFGCRVRNRAVPEEAIAYPLEYLRTAVEKAGLEIRQMHLGQWAGRVNFLTYQDVCLLGPR